MPSLPHTFLVDSPLQLLNAVEAREAFDIPANNASLVLLRGASANTLYQMDRMVPKLGWQDVRRLPVGHDLRGLLTGLRRSVDWLADLIPSDTVYIGEYRSELMRHLANRLAARRQVVLDDGTSTVALVRFRHRPDLAPDRYFGSTGVKALVKRLMGLRSHHPTEVTYFSAYAFDPGRDIHILNDFTHLRGLMMERPYGKRVWLLGQPLSELGILHRGDYEAFVASFAKDLQEPLVYVPHRREDPEWVASMAHEQGLEVMQAETAIEFFLCFEAAELPCRIVSFYSSALTSLHYIVGDKIRLQALRIPHHAIRDPDRREAIDAVYDSFRALRGLTITTLHADSS